jgi:hypothetical protein
VSKKHNRDFLQEHQEWVDHMYNPGYWVNRITSRDIAMWRWTRRRNKLNGFLGMLISAISVLAVAYPAIEKSKEVEVSFISIMLQETTFWPALFAAFLFIMFFVLFIQKTDRNEKK